MLLLNTVKLVLIAINILPNRVKHKKIMFFIYMATLVTHGELFTLLSYLTIRQKRGVENVTYLFSPRLPSTL